MNLPAKESGKSRQRHKDVNAALLSDSEAACDPEPNAFDYINYCESDSASGTDLTTIHNSGLLQTGLSGSGYRQLLIPRKKRDKHTHSVSHMKAKKHKALHFVNPHVLLLCQQIPTLM